MGIYGRGCEQYPGLSCYNTQRASNILFAVMVKMHDLDWLFSIGIIFFLISIWGIGANDVANSYATSVSSKSLTLVQAGVLATITEFVGAIALGQQVTSTIRSGVFSITLFENSPGVLLMANVVAEIGMSTLRA